MAIRQYTNTSAQATTSAALASTDTSITLTGYTGFPSAPFTAALARGTALEEVVLVTAVNNSTVTVTRGYDGTSAKTQAAGTTFQHVVVALDLQEANAHVNGTTGVHGVTGSVVGTTDVQTLSNKTLTSPAVNSPTVSGGTFTGTTAVTTLTVSGVSTLTGLLTANGGISTTTVAASGAVSGTTLTGTGLVKGAGLESTASAVLAQLAADDAGVAGKTTVYGKTDGGLYARNGTGAVRSLKTHWGSGTTFPTLANGLQVGDTYVHTGLASLMTYTGTGIGTVSWRQVHIGQVANAAAVNAVSTTYPSLIYPGFRLQQADAPVPQEWNGTKWRAQGGTYTVGLMPTWAGGGVRVHINGNVATVHWDVYNQGANFDIAAWGTYPIVGAGNMPAPAMSNTSGAWAFSNTNAYNDPAFWVGANNAGEFLVQSRWGARTMSGGTWLLGTMSYPI